MNGCLILYVARYVAFPTDWYSFPPRNMMSKNINFQIVSLNVRGIRSFAEAKGRA